MFEVTVTQNYPNGQEETWRARIDGEHNLKAHVGAVCQSVTATSWVFVITKIPD